MPSPMTPANSPAPDRPGRSRCRGWPRTLARLLPGPWFWSEWPRRLAVKGGPEAHFRRKREAPLTVRGATAQSRGHPRTWPFPGSFPGVPAAAIKCAGLRGLTWEDTPAPDAANCRPGPLASDTGPRDSGPFTGHPGPFPRIYVVGAVPAMKTAILARQHRNPGAPPGIQAPGTGPWASQLPLHSRTPPLIPWTGLGGVWPNGSSVRCTR